MRGPSFVSNVDNMHQSLEGHLESEAQAQFDRLVQKGHAEGVVGFDHVLASMETMRYEESGETHFAGGSTVCALAHPCVVELAARSGGKRYQAHCFAFKPSLDARAPASVVRDGLISRPHVILRFGLTSASSPRLSRTRY